MLFLKQDNNKKEWVDMNVTKLDANNSNKYEMKAIHNSAIYRKESKSGHLPRLYYLVF